MALVLADRVKETTTTTGTATYTLAGASTGFESFASIGDGNTTYYACTDGTDFEVGIGTYTASGTTLARTTILQSSNSDAAVSWSSGTKTIFCCQPAEKAVFLDASGNIAAFNGSNLTNVNATTLDNLDSTQFLRSDAADTKTSGDLTFSDNVKAVFGTGSDLEILHDGSNSLIRDIGGGSLYLTTNGASIFFRNSADNEDLAKFINGGAVELYYDNALRFTTTSSGSIVTGTLVADGLDIARDTAASAEIGRAHIGNVGFSDFAGFSHVDADATGSYALLQSSSGQTFINGASGQYIKNRINNSDIMTINASGVFIDIGELTLTSTDAGATENPTLDLYRNSASPADQDIIGHINFSGENDAGEKIVYGEIQTRIRDVTDGTENGAIETFVETNGSLDLYTVHQDGQSQFYKDVAIISNDAGATENPTLDLYRNSASPADNDVLGHINFSGEDSAGNKTVYAKINADAIDVTDGTEDGRLDFKVISNGSESQRITLAGSQTIFQNADVKISDADLLLESTDAGASDAPTIDLFRNSSSPASGDQLGQINFTGKDDGGNTTTFAAISSTIAADPTDGNERGGLELQVASNGTLTSYVKMLTNTIQLFKDTQLFGDFTLNSTADSGAVLKLVSNDPADAADFGIEGVVQFYAENDASESTLYYSMQLQTADISDGSEDGWLYLNSRKDGALNVANAFGADGSMYILGSGNGGEGALKWFQTRSTSHTVSVKPNTPTASRNIFLPDATGTAMVAVFYDSYSSSNVTLGSSDQVIDFDTNRQNSDTAVFSESAGVITVAKAGTYMMTYDVTTGISSGTSRSECRMAMQRAASGSSEFSDIAGSISRTYNRTLNLDSTTGTATIMYSITAGDQIRVVARRTNGTSTTRLLGGECRFNMMALKIG